MSDYTQKTSSELERDVEHTRSNLSGTLAELRDRMSPGQIVDELFSVARNNGAGEMVNNLGRTVRDNPAPLLLIGAGLIWMAAGGGARSAPAVDRDRAPWRDERLGVRSAGNMGRDPGSWSSSDRTDWRGAGSAPSQGSERGLADKASDMAGQAADSVRSGVDAVTGAVSDAAGAVADSVSSAYDSVTGGVSSAYDSVSGGVSDGYDRGRYMTMQGSRRVSDTVSTLMRDQPLVLGAVGLTLGAVLGALLPETRAENRLMGDTADALKDEARSVAADQYEKGKAVAARAVEQVKDAAAEKGLTADSVRSGIEQAGRSVKDAIRDTKESVTDEARKQGLTEESRVARADDDTSSRTSPGQSDKGFPGSTKPGGRQS